MRNIKLLIITLFIANIANGQIANFENISLNKKNIIQASFGLNIAAISSIDYSRVVELKQKLYLISASVVMPMGKELFDDYKLTLGISGNLSIKNHWQAPIHIGLLGSSSNNKMAKISTFGTYISLNPGYYSESWFLASEIVYDKFILSNIANSEYYKAAYFSGARDGWYKKPGGNYHVGIIGGKTIKSSELTLKAGIVTTEKLVPLLVPYYAQVGYKFAF